MHKESICNAGDARDASSIPGSGRSPGGGHGNPLQHSCLENPMDKGAWWATVHRSDMTEVTEHTHTRWLSEPGTGDMFPAIAALLTLKGTWRVSRQLR